VGLPRFIASRCLGSGALEALAMQAENDPVCIIFAIPSSLDICYETADTYYQTINV